MSADNWADCPRCMRRHPLATDTDTFREDYEIGLNDDGTVVVNYSGYCTECNLGLSFSEVREIPGIDD